MQTDEEILNRLDTIRGRFTWRTAADDAEYLRLIAECIERGVYPAKTVPGNPNTVYTMVECWGARWHVWRAPFECPHCEADLRCRRTGPPFKREIHVTIYDEDYRKTRYIECPDCGKRI